MTKRPMTQKPSAKRLEHGEKSAYLCAQTRPVEPAMSVAFDTLKAAQRLSAAGFSEEQAATLAATFAEGITENLATKDDIALVQKDVKAGEERLTADIKALDAKIDNSVAALQNDMKALDAKIDNSVTALNDKIDNSVAALDDKIDLVKETLETKIESTSRSTIIWLGSAIIAAAVILGVMDRFFPPPG